MNIHDFYRPILKYFRSKRMKKFCQVFNISNSTRILDMGGLRKYWNFLEIQPMIEIVNISFKYKYRKTENIIQKYGDCTQLPYGNKTFDIVHSNSVIEHVGGLKAATQFSKEACRLGINLWIQTPNKYFFIEPHYISFVVHFLFPYCGPRVRYILIRYCTVLGIMTKPNLKKTEELFHDINLLSYSDLKGLFPGYHIHKEKFLFFFTKSFVVCNKVPH